jgi:hypothetical protein
MTPLRVLVVTNIIHLAPGADLEAKVQPGG